VIALLFEHGVDQALHVSSDSRIPDSPQVEGNFHWRRVDEVWALLLGLRHRGKWIGFYRRLARRGFVFRDLLSPVVKKVLKSLPKWDLRPPINRGTDLLRASADHFHFSGAAARFL
jgi:hypothetical protein